jgi:hypothetical protein
VVRVDEKTKEFLNVYPLECVKKWAASPNTFTLDFGDHFKEPYYSMQTTEGEHIARLISGYIDIILKKVFTYFFFKYIAHYRLIRPFLPDLKVILTFRSQKAVNKINLNSQRKQ